MVPVAVGHSSHRCCPIGWTGWSRLLELTSSVFLGSSGLYFVLHNFIYHCPRIRFRFFFLHALQFHVVATSCNSTFLHRTSVRWGTSVPCTSVRCTSVRLLFYFYLIDLFIYLRVCTYCNSTSLRRHAIPRPCDVLQFHISTLHFCSMRHLRAVLLFFFSFKKNLRSHQDM